MVFRRIIGGKLSQVLENFLFLLLLYRLYFNIFVLNVINRSHSYSHTRTLCLHYNTTQSGHFSLVPNLPSDTRGTGKLPAFSAKLFNPEYYANFRMAQFGMRICSICWCTGDWSDLFEERVSSPYHNTAKHYTKYLATKQLSGG